MSHKYAFYLTVLAAVALPLLGGLGIGLLWGVSPLLGLLIGGAAAVGAVLVWYLGFWSKAEDERMALLEQLDRTRQNEARLQDQLRTQEAMLTGLSEQLATTTSPVIPIRDRAVMMPLIGVVQAEQMERITQNLLREIERRSARVALLDLTGVTALPAAVIPVLTRMLAAIELMGCQAVITGLSTEAARDLLTHKPDLHVQARLNLEAGIAYANRLLE